MEGAQVSLDGGTASVQVGADGRFAITEIPNGDGINDLFVDADGDGINDLTGHGYVSGYGHGDGGHLHDPVDWPMEPPHMGGGGMM